MINFFPAILLIFGLCSFTPDKLDASESYFNSKDEPVKSLLDTMLCGNGCAIDIFVGQSNADRLFFTYESARDTFLSDFAHTGDWDCFISAATGSTSIDLHLPGGQLFEANDSIIRVALDAKLASGCPIVYPTIHWWQGETDSTPEGVTSYPEKFLQIFEYYNSIFGLDFRMFIYEINTDPQNFDDEINKFFIRFANQNNNVSFVEMPSNTTYINPPLNNHPSVLTLFELLTDHFNNKLAGDCGTAWSGFPTTSVVDDGPNKISFRISPNPAFDNLRFDFDILTEKSILSMYTIEGQLVFVDELLEGISYYEKSLSQFQLPSGVYFVRLHNSKKVTDQLVQINS